MSIRCGLRPDQMLDVWPKAPSEPTGGRQRARGRRGALNGRTIRRLSPGRHEREFRYVGKPCSGTHAAVGAQRRSSVWSRPRGSVRRSRMCRAPARHPGLRREGLQAVFHGGSTGKAVRLRSQELGPRWPDLPWRRAESAFAKHRGDGGVRNADPELQEFPTDPEVAPPGILPAQPKDQVPDRGIQRRATGRPRASPASSLEEVPVPSPQRVRADQEALPPVPGQGPSRCREEGSIRGGEEDPPTISAEDLQLLVEHRILESQLIEAAADDQAEHPAQKPVPDRPEHPGSLMAGRPACELPGPEWPIEFPTHRGCCRSSPDVAELSPRREENDREVILSPRISPWPSTSSPATVTSPPCCLNRASM